jgi:hypothetical protein
LLLSAAAALASGIPASAEEHKVRLRGEVVDADTGQPLPARVYLQREDGTWFFAQAEAKAGSAVPYRKQRADYPRSVEMHTTLSAHPFVADVPPGRYTITVERGKEYVALVRAVTIEREGVKVRLPLHRWIDLGELGWYSGDTHVHRGLEELPNVMLAEDLNVAFPLLYWVTEAFASPRTSPRGPARDPDAKPVAIDATHVFYPRNTEYEIFNVAKKPHMLGAIFVLNHQSVFEQGVPPVGPVAERARREGGLLEMDKHNWPWSMMLVPGVRPDLYELSNNHIWRTEFSITRWAEPAPAYMRAEHDARGITEAGWIDYGFQNYYALLDCGFRLRPTAGTASGVHPVPLGFGRVYVHLPDGFSYEAWLRGLNAGRSFVTTGPMLFVQLDGQPPGHTFRPDAATARDYHLIGKVLSEQPLQRIEVVVNGEVVRAVKPANHKGTRQAHESPIDERLTIDGSSWIAVRCFESRADKRVRFAHSAPFHVDVPGKPLRPRRAEIEFLVRRVEEQLARSANVLPAAALDEYRQALRVYREIARNAR